MSSQYSLSQLKRKRTISVGQADSLKIDDGKTRVWLARTGVADGEPYNNKVTIEKLIDGRWEIVDTYPALETVGCCGKLKGRELRVREPGANMPTPFVSMTYGTMPPYRSFEQRLRGAVDEEGALLVGQGPPVYHMELAEHTEIDSAIEVFEKMLPRGLRRQVKIGPGSGQKWKTRIEIETLEALYAFIDGLRKLWDSESVYREAAGDLASSIMQTLHYEWV